ncbi:MAG: stage II sporulation protein R [Firmicutes bacterium]|nr:stage II sporulation protein R [Bacillota bacterium]
MIANKFRSRLLFSSIALAAALLLGFFGMQVTSNGLPAEEAFNLESLIRLHVVANSDSPADQELKLQVRDAVIAQTQHLFAGVGSKVQAWEQLNLHKDVVQAAAQEAVSRYGKHYPVEVQLGEYAFPERDYGSMVVPAGDYQAVKVIIGEGKGRNWWCVLFPPLCLMDVDGAGAAQQPIIRREAVGEGEARQLVVEWRLKYLDNIYREYGERLAALWDLVRGRTALSAAQLSS